MARLCQLKTLDDAWRWYQTTKQNGELIRHLARRYWDDLPWDGAFGRDEPFETLDAVLLQKDCESSLAPLADLAVLVLFSVFEGIVRDHILAELKVEAEGLKHRVLIASMAQIIQDTKEGSFFRVLEPFKLSDAPLVEEVNQVRRYRNWVAHARRTEHSCPVNPLMAYDRSTSFLDTFSIRPPEQPRGES